MSDKDKPSVLLEYYLKRLRLPTILREYASMAEVCSQDRSDFTTYLLRLVEREVLDREKRAAERRIREAKFPVLKTIDTFDFKAQPSINEQLIRELMGGEYLDKRNNVLLIGNPGTGKTHLACAIAFAACAQGKKVRFHTATALVPGPPVLVFLGHAGKNSRWMPPSWPIRNPWNPPPRFRPSKHLAPWPRHLKGRCCREPVVFR